MRHLLTRRSFLWNLSWSLLLLFASGAVFATDIQSTPTRTFVGYIDYVGTGNTLRTASDAVDACLVGASSNATLAGIPSGANLEAVYLYWAASGQATDFNVNFNGVAISADLQYTEVVSTTRSYFSGVTDVTSLVSGNGTYSFSGLTVDTGAAYCGVNGVLAGWALVAIYSEASEPFRTINMFEGLQNFWGSAVSLTPSNFVVPGSGIDGRLGVLSWEGDSGNSGTRNGVTENLFFDGQNTAQTALSDGLNPVNEQYNSTLNSSGSTNVYGVDFDIYDIGSRLTSGDTTASTLYQSGQDRVFLSLQIIAVTNTPSTDLSLDKTATTTFARGSTGSFEFTVSNLGPLTHNDNITITDTLPAGLEFDSFTSVDLNWNCTGTTTVTCTHTGSEILVGADLPSVTVNVSVGASATGTLTNSAVLVSNVFDAFQGNNTDTADALILEAELSGSSKTVTDVNGGLVQPGDTLEFRVNIADSNDAGAVVNVTDALSALLTNLVVVDAAGGTDVSTGNTLNIQNINLPAGGMATLRFTADIVASAAVGDVISNTATVEDAQLATTLDVSSVDLTIGNTSAASGTKQLYLNNILADPPTAGSPLTMSRVPLTAVSAPFNRLRIRRQDTRSWAMTPATTGDLTIDSSSIPVRLLLQRNSQTQTRDLRVTLSYSGAASGTIGCAELTVASSEPAGLSASVTREFIFNVPRTDANCVASPGLPLTLPAGTTIHMNVDNQIGGTGNGRAIYVYPFDATLGTSHLELPALTVINVDSLELFDDALPGGAPLTSVKAGDRVYFRSVVSDPFGSADISDATLAVVNASGGSELSVDLDPTHLVATAAGSKTYEFEYVIPTAGLPGTWVAAVQALEGTEGTISHTRLTNFPVVEKPVITLAKVARTDSDPMGSAKPKSIPGAIIEFSIEVHNQGPGSADLDSIVVVDTLPPQARLLFDTATQSPILLIQGATPSGVTYNFISPGSIADDIEFSNDGGASTLTPSFHPVTGLDTTVPRVNYLRINPKGTLVETASGPSFTLRLLMQLD